MADIVGVVPDSQWEKQSITFKAQVLKLAAQTTNTCLARAARDVHRFMASETEIREHDLEDLQKHLENRDLTGIRGWLGRVRVVSNPSVALPGPTVVRPSSPALSVNPVVHVMRKPVGGEPSPNHLRLAPKTGVLSGSRHGVQDQKKKPDHDARMSRTKVGVRQILAGASQRVVAFLVSMITGVQNFFHSRWMHGNPLDDSCMRLMTVLVVGLLFTNIMVPGRVGISSFVRRGSPVVGAAYAGIDHYFGSSPIWKSPPALDVHFDHFTDSVDGHDSLTTERELHVVGEMSDELASADIRIGRGDWTDQDFAMLKRHEQTINELVVKYGSLALEIGQKKGGELDTVKKQPLRLGTGLGCVGRRRLPLPAMTDGRIAAHTAQLETLKGEIRELRANLDRVTEFIRNDPYKQAYRNEAKRNSELTALNGLLLVLVGSVVTTGVIFTMVPGTYTALTNAFGLTWLGTYLDNLVPVALYSWLHWGVSTPAE